MRNKIPLAEQATSGHLRPQQKAVREDKCPSERSLGKLRAPRLRGKTAGDETSAILIRHSARGLGRLDAASAAVS
jgi:hypothetical protein